VPLGPAAVSATIALTALAVGRLLEIQPRGDEMTWQLAWLLLPAGAMALVGYGGRGLWADMTADERRFAVRFSSLMLGAFLTGATLLALIV
jgi:hypothetical protein